VSNPFVRAGPADDAGPGLVKFFIVERLEGKAGAVNQLQSGT
jgi:hypothetical protein